MTEYALYLESGPRRKKTMVHVIDLLGCIAQGPTTEAALESTPEAIRLYLRFLQSHGDAVKPESAFRTKIAAHIMEGSWIGNGDPTSGFAPDFQPLATKDLKIYLQRLDWLQTDLLELTVNINRKKMTEEPKAGGRSIEHILQHVSEAHGSYLRYLVGKVDGLSEALRAVRESPSEMLPVALLHMWEISEARLKILSGTERSRFVQHGQLTGTARRCMRRMLEHEWEHFMEISSRLKPD